MKNISRASIILSMVFFFVQVNQSNAVVSVPGALNYPLLAQLAGMLYHGASEVCSKSSDDNRTVAKKIVDVTTHAAAYSGTFAGFHYVKAGFEAVGVNEANASRAAVCLGVIIGGAIGDASNKLGSLALTCCGCRLTKERAPPSDEELSLQTK